MSESDLAERLDEFLVNYLEGTDETTGENRGETIIRAIVEQAMKGDADAVKVVWARIDAAERRESWK